MDSAAHLYNANLLKYLLFTNNSQLNYFFTLNKELVPNWSCHAILTIFSLIFPAFIAEKSLLLIYAIGLPVAFYKLIKYLSPDNYKLSILILPFVYTFLFGLGFYNFSLGIVVILITTYYWLKIKNDITLKRYLLFFVLIFLAYFTHIFIFAILLFVLFSISIIGLINDVLNKTFNKKKYFIEFLSLITVSLPFIVLFASFILNREHISSNNRLPVNELIQWIKDIRSLIIYNYSRELIFTRIIFYIIFSLIIITIYTKLNNYFRHNSDKQKINLNNYTWLFISLFVLVLYFVLPDSNSGGGYISQRLNILFFIFLIIWVAIQRFPKWLTNVVISVIIIANFSLVYRYTNTIKNLNKEAVEFEKAAIHIKDYSTVLPIKNSNSWLDGHFSNYLGINKPLIILENYEASTGYFPIKWNDTQFPKLTLGENYYSQSCINWKTSDNSQITKPIDYIIIYGNNDLDGCKKEVIKIIKNQYKQIYISKNGFIKIFQY